MGSPAKVANDKQLEFFFLLCIKCKVAFFFPIVRLWYSSVQSLQSLKVNMHVMVSHFRNMAIYIFYSLRCSQMLNFSKLVHMTFGIYK